MFLLGGIWARFGAVFGCSGVMGVSDGPPRLRVGVLTWKKISNANIWLASYFPTLLDEI